jgi:3-oxoacyl-[acyl-carrier protein] reductase
LGRAIAAALARCGARVACLARDSARLAETVATIRTAGGEAEAFAGDVTRSDDVAQLVEQVLARFEKIDILVNNAGVTRDGLVARMSDDQWDAVLNTNLKAAFWFVRAVTRPMMQNRYGRIINISSVSGLRGNAGQANYAASKAGLIGLTRSVAKELASRNITVNAVAPGFIETDMTHALGEAAQAQIKEHVPLRRLGQPGEVADAVIYLASAAGAYVTAQVISVDGGLTG